MNTILTTAARRIGAGITAFLVAKMGVPEEAAQHIIIAGSVFVSVVIDGIATTLIARFR